MAESLQNPVIKKFKNEFIELFSVDFEVQSSFISHLKRDDEVMPMSVAGLKDKNFEHIFDNYVVYMDLHEIITILSSKSLPRKCQRLLDLITRDWQEYIKNIQAFHKTATNHMRSKFKEYEQNAPDSRAETFKNIESIFSNGNEKYKNKIMITDSDWKKNKRYGAHIDCVMYLWSNGHIFSQDFLLLKLSINDSDLGLSLETNLFKQNFHGNTDQNFETFKFYLTNKNANQFVKAAILVDGIEKLKKKESDVFQKIHDDSYHIPIFMWTSAKYAEKHFKCYPVYRLNDMKLNILLPDSSDSENSDEDMDELPVRDVIKIEINQKNTQSKNQVVSKCILRKVETLKEINVQHIDLKPDNFRVNLEKVIGLQKNLEVLFLSFCDITNEGLISIFNNVEVNCHKIKKLYFAKMGINGNVTEAAARAIRNLKSLTLISFSYNKLESSGVEKILRAINENCYWVKEIYMRDVGIDSSIGDILGDAIGKQTNLEVLYLNSNNIGDNVAKHLLDNIKQNCLRMKELLIADIGMIDELGDIIAENISELKYLNIFSCSFNPLSELSCKLILRELTKGDIQLIKLFLPDGMLLDSLENDLIKALSNQLLLEAIYIRGEKKISNSRFAKLKGACKPSTIIELP